MSDDIYVIYYNGKFVGMLSDSESFWYLYEWLSDSDGVCNVVTVSKDNIDISEDITDFMSFAAKYGELTVERSRMSVTFDYDDNLI